MDTKTLEAYFDRLWPICRSITGDGLRESFRILSEIVPFELHEVPTGTKVFDWEIPQEWNVSCAYIITPEGKRIADFEINNLHLVNYSIPVNDTFTFDELSKHLHTLPSQPEVIPYVTSYYRDDWGFCISQNLFDALPREGDYTVVIDSSKTDGALTYGQVLLKGQSEKEILISSYLCHPSMANNELSGPLALAALYRALANLPHRRFSYRFVLAPETIGVIAFLSQYGEALKQNIHAGLVLTCCADPGPITFQRSKRGDTAIDKMVEHILEKGELDYSTRDFRVGGSDERQYCSPGFNFPVGTLMRTPYKLFKEYHTSGDNKAFISFDALAEFVSVALEVFRGLELNDKYFSTVQHGEAMLGKRGLYAQKGAWMTDPSFRHALLTILAYADGEVELIEVAKKYDQSILDYSEPLKVLLDCALLSREAHTQ